MYYTTADLWTEDKAQCDSCTEENEEGDERVGGVRPVGHDESDRYARSTHDDDVVDAQAYVLGVVQGRYGHVTRFPSKETTNHLPATIIKIF